MTLKISISGIRGIIGDSLTDDVITHFASAFATWINKQRPLVIIGRDSRASGEAIQAQVTKTLTNFGCDVVNIGICPTPTVQLAVKDHHAAGGIVITASHNPIQWNGLKFISAAGIFLKPNEAEEMIGIYESKKFAAPRPAG